MHSHATTSGRRARAQAALNDAARDPILDGLIGWYAQEASHLAAGHQASVDLDELVAALTSTDEDRLLRAGYTYGELAAAGVLRATTRSRYCQAA